MSSDDDLSQPPVLVEISKNKQETTIIIASYEMYSAIKQMLVVYLLRSNTINNYKIILFIFL